MNVYVKIVYVLYEIHVLSISYRFERRDQVHQTDIGIEHTFIPPPP